MGDSKTCSKCGVAKPVQAFNKDSGAPDGKFRWCRDCARANSLKHYYADPEKYIDRVKQRRQDPEKYQRQLESNKRWRERNKDTASAANKRAQARSRGALVADLTAAEWTMLLDAHKHQCAYCQVKFTDDNPPQQDHIIPVSRGGAHTLGNVAPACRKCNRHKGDKTLTEYQQMLLKIGQPTTQLVESMSDTPA